MIRPKVILFTKTRWSEPPRLRHQVAKLLTDMGYEVVFFECPSYKSWFQTRRDENMIFVNHFELIHHRLRFSNFLVKINSYVTKFFIKKAIKKLNIENVPVVNFCYDYYFLKDLFSTNIVTIINDDFVNKIKNSTLRKITENQLVRTSENSKVNLAVSYPLRDQLKQFTNNVELFFPWAEEEYKIPEFTRKRDVALFFGYINYRLDWSLVLGIVKKGIKVRFIGPIEKSVDKKKLEEARTYANVEFLSPMNIKEIDFSDICCSILPWDRSLDGVQAITVNNKCFSLLSYGIPQVYSDLPHLIKADTKAIAKCSTADEMVNTINYFSENFEDCQEPIEDFLKQNYSEERGLALKRYLNEIGFLLQHNSRTP